LNSELQPVIAVVRTVFRTPIFPSSEMMELNILKLL
jgi:hypothetical protein